MSKIFGQNIDFNKNESLNFRLGNLIGFPSLGASDSGYTFFHSGNLKFYGWDGSAWTELGLGGAGAADGVISNVQLSGTDLIFTGSGGGFNGTVPLSSLSGGSGGGNFVTIDTAQDVTASKNFRATTIFSENVFGNNAELTNFTRIQGNVLDVLGGSGGWRLEPESSGANVQLSKNSGTGSGDELFVFQGDGTIDDGNNVLRRKDFTEGDFTPVLIDSSGGATYSPSYSVGKYQRMLNTVYFQIVLATISTSGTPTGSLRVTGLPFTPINVEFAVTIGRMGNNSTNPDNLIRASIYGSAGYIQFYEGNNTLFDAYGSSISTVSLSGVYQTS